MAKEQRLIDAFGLTIRLSKKNAKRPLHYDDVLAIIADEKSVDAVEVVRGEWVGTQYDGYADGCPVYDLWECSNCREEYESEGDPPPYNYCPNCGAKMDGDGNG